MIAISYNVIEHWDRSAGGEDFAPEPFGTYHHNAGLPEPRVGDVILLRWLDGRPAYRVKIIQIEGATLHTKGNIL